MANNKKIIFTREDYEKAAAQQYLLDEWKRHLLISGEAALCMVTVNSEGKKMLHMMKGADFKKMAAVLKHISEQLETTLQPAQTKAD